MKEIYMKKYVMGNKGWNESSAPVLFNRVSRWIKVQHNYNPCKRNRLWDYVEDENGYEPYQDEFNPENGLYLDYFRYNGRTYAVEQFIALGSMWAAVSYSYEEDGKTAYLSGYDGEDIYTTMFVEFDEYCENVRVYEEVV